MADLEDGHRASPQSDRDEGGSGLIDLAPPINRDHGGRPGPAGQGREADGRPCQSDGARRAPCDKGLAEGLTEPLLRKAFAQHLRNSPYLTPGLAQTLAHDVETMPLLRPGSTKASDEGRDDTKASNGQGSTAAVPLTALAEAAYDLSLHLRDLLIARHNLPAELADRITLHGREGTLIRAVEPGRERGELLAFVSYLSKNGGLTSSFLLRALCLGHMPLFEIAVARLTGNEIDEAGCKIHGSDRSGFADLYKSAGLPDDLYRAFRVAVKVHNRLSDGQAGAWNHGNTIEVIESLVKEYEHVSPEDLEHVLSQLAREQRKPLPPVENLKFASA